MKMKTLLSVSLQTLLKITITQSILIPINPPVGTATEGCLLRYDSNTHLVCCLQPCPEKCPDGIKENLCAIEESNENDIKRNIESVHERSKRSLFSDDPTFPPANHYRGSRSGGEGFHNLKDSAKTKREGHLIDDDLDIIDNRRKDNEKNDKKSFDILIDSDIYSNELRSKRQQDVDDFLEDFDNDNWDFRGIRKSGKDFENKRDDNSYNGNEQQERKVGFKRSTRRSSRRVSRRRMRRSRRRRNSGHKTQHSHAWEDAGISSDSDEDILLKDKWDFERKRDEETPPRDRWDFEYKRDAVLMPNLNAKRETSYEARNIRHGPNIRVYGQEWFVKREGKEGEEENQAEEEEKQEEEEEEGEEEEKEGEEKEEDGKQGEEEEKQEEENPEGNPKDNEKREHSKANERGLREDEKREQARDYWSDFEEFEEWEPMKKSYSNEKDNGVRYVNGGFGRGNIFTNRKKVYVRQSDESPDEHTRDGDGGPFY